MMHKCGGKERNISKQFTKGLIDKVIDDDLFGFGLLYYLGLFGDGPVSLPTTIDSKGYTYTLNENGTVIAGQRLLISHKIINCIFF